MGLSNLQAVIAKPPLGHYHVNFYLSEKCRYKSTRQMPQQEMLHKKIPVKQAFCLATDACLTADPGVASSIPARYHTFVEIDHEIISTVILLPSSDLFKKGCCQLQAKVCAQITG